MKIFIILILRAINYKCIMLKDDIKINRSLFTSNNLS